MAEGNEPITDPRKEDPADPEKTLPAGDAPTTPWQGMLPYAPGAGRPTVPGFEILEELGHGGMGVVYKARQLEADRVVALKVIRSDRLTHPDAVRRFRREAQAAARLAHPHIVAVYEWDHSGETHFIAMEYVEGVNLQRLVERSGGLPVHEACAYIRQVALGLQHAFERGIVHRDIKPSNLMLVSGRVVSGPEGTGQGAATHEPPLTTHHSPLTKS